ncbi:PRC-barrel domain-containing protein [Oscillatoria salina]|uniref:PRC-barrel domain-containing protein n=1 Tax=Oscillatoria salina TaxID=331517 RepID=UPI0013B73288|nr:PRC-barrel domain-containing protein [Oscillatoria salina]MBZ8179601.1 photosystem reaction center subunit H [Oscillatoria salina IIICB1]NET87665.1 photosystem reaction center subunit H [Kamptonema sp. SIO1D9]
MTTQPELMRRSQLINKLVLERRTTDKVGNVEQLWLDPHAHEIQSFSCKSGLFGHNKLIFTWEQIETIGHDCILVNCSPTEAMKEKPDRSELIINHEVWTDAGVRAGKIVDYLFNLQTGKVVGYLFVADGWEGVTDGTYILEPVAISSVGNKRAIVFDRAARNAAKFSEGLKNKIEQATSFFSADYAQTRKEVETALSKAKEAAESVAFQAKDKLNEAKNKLQKSANSEETQPDDRPSSELENQENVDF